MPRLEAIQIVRVLTLVWLTQLTAEVQSAREAPVELDTIASEFVVLREHQQDGSFPVPAQYGTEPTILENDEPGMSREQLRRLMRPSVSLTSEWQSETNGLGISAHDARVSVPTYPIFGPPPPFIDLGFAYTNLRGAGRFGLPIDLFETRFGLSWMRRLNDRWMMRLMGGTSFATDGENNTSDAWQFRGGAFAIYRRSPAWTFAFGAIALGRNDLPVLPAVGLIYQPNPGCRVDLMMPRPRVSFLLRDNGPRQQWGYLGAALNGTTWGVERVDGVDDQLSYGDVRFVVGFESTPTPEPGMPFTRGRKMFVEIGYAISRDFEWEREAIEISLDDAFLLRGGLSF